MREHRLVLIIVLSAFAIIGGSGWFMSRVGAERSGGEAAAALLVGDAAGAGSRRSEPLVPTATFNVSEKLGNGVNLIPSGKGLADQLLAEEAEPADDLEAVSGMIDLYSNLFHGIPSGGENVDIMRALTGGNERRIAVIPPDHPALNEQGELMDRWGNPYVFHPVSRDLLEVRSAGPDGKLWTEDDLEQEGLPEVVQGAASR